MDRSTGRRVNFRPGIAILVAAIVGALIGVGCAAQSAKFGPQTLRILGSWEGPELDAFEKVIKPFEERTGYRVDYTATRNLRGVLESGFEANDPPDLAGLPGPGYMIELARQGRLVELSDVLDVGTYKRETAPAFVDLGTVEGKLVGAFIKGTVKGLFWYEPDVYKLGTPATWIDLQHSAMMSDEGIRPWCIGLASDASSGWPGTDWIEDFVLRQSGPDVYDGWVAGTVPWTSTPIRHAFQAFGTVVADGVVAGGIDGALRTHFSRSGDGLLTTPPQCLFVHQGSFMTAFLEDSVGRLGGSFDFMPFPDIDPRYSDALIGAGDLVALTRDTPGGRELIRYLVSAEAQSIWVREGGALSANLTVSDYKDDISEREAELLRSARIFRFDASDSMPDPLDEAFWQAVLDFTADQGKLDSILEHLDAIRVNQFGGA